MLLPLGSKAAKPADANRAETAAGRMTAPVALARADESAHTVRERLRGAASDTWDLLCIIDPEGRLEGVVRPATLLALPGDAPVGSAALRRLPHVLPHTDQERVASVALHHRLPAVPVVDAAGRLQGVVNGWAVMDILRHEHVEDLHRLAGITREGEQAREALESPPLRRARHRLPWLMVGLLGSTFATFVMSRFEQALAQLPAIAFFIPGLVYMADAIGTQSEAIAVRGLSLSHVGLAQLFGSETRTGLLMGGVLALPVFPLVWLGFGQLRLACAVVVALIAASAVATSVGLLLPWLLGRLGTDPAYGSGPLATILQDLLTLLIYFAGVSAIVL
ncbi:MAG TPA: magnesium transporter [Ramlibacter sp.]|nr:magnesium transporter [Ramlibacter sp.]